MTEAQAVLQHLDEQEPLIGGDGVGLCKECHKPLIRRGRNRLYDCGHMVYTQQGPKLRSDRKPEQPAAVQTGGITETQRHNLSFLIRESMRLNEIQLKAYREYKESVIKVEDAMVAITIKQ